jgi:hypothetical protein
LKFNQGQLQWHMPEVAGGLRQKDYRLKAILATC